MGSLLFLSDRHGNISRAQLSLEHSGVAHVTKDGSLDILRDDTVISLGDNLDHGNNNLEVLELMKEMRAKMKKLVFVLGNHEALLLHSLLPDPDKADTLNVGKWMFNGGCAVLSEVANKQHLPKTSVTSIFPVSTEHLPAGDQLNMLICWQELVKDRKLEHTDFREALLILREIFHSKYINLFESMELVHREGSVLGVHGGMNEYWADHLNEAPALLKKMFKEKNFGPMIEPGEQSELTWMKRKHQPDQKLISQKTGKKLLAQGICVIARGHEQCISGQDVWVEAGVGSIETNTRGWNYTRIDDGKMSAGSEVYKDQYLGDIVDGKFVRAKA